MYTARGELKYFNTLRGKTYLNRSLAYAFYFIIHWKRMLHETDANSDTIFSPVFVIIQVAGPFFLSLCGLVFSVPGIVLISYIFRLAAMTKNQHILLTHIIWLLFKCEFKNSDCRIPPHRDTSVLLWFEMQTVISPATWIVVSKRILMGKSGHFHFDYLC